MLKIIKSSREDILRRKEEYERDYNRRKSVYDVQKQAYDEAVVSIQEYVQEQLEKELNTSKFPALAPQRLLCAPRASVQQFPPQPFFFAARARARPARCSRCALIAGIAGRATANRVLSPPRPRGAEGRTDTSDRTRPTHSLLATGEYGDSARRGGSCDAGHVARRRRRCARGTRNVRPRWCCARVDSRALRA